MFNHVKLDREVPKLQQLNENGTRYYVTPEGNKYPSITTVLAAYNIGYIMEWRKRVGEEVANKISQTASGRGTRIHTLCEQYIDNKKPEFKSPLDQELFNCASKAITEYRNVFKHCTIELDSGYDLLKYDVGCFYKTHTDSFKDRPRAVSCSFALNNGYEGGDFAFFDRGLTYTLEKGSCLMFPSNFMYPHEITPVTSGTRYSIVTWFV
jgi:predicted 2-oxoglutarate/Fe(II)-dependent dioxygenase YbiX